MQQKRLPCNPVFYTCSSPKPMIWERKGMVDVMTVQKLGRELSEWSREVEAALARLGLIGEAKSRHSTEPLFSALLALLQSLRNTCYPTPTSSSILCPAKPLNIPHHSPSPAAVLLFPCTCPIPNLKSR